MSFLRFDADRLYEDLVNECLIPSANQAIESVSKYIKRSLSSGMDIKYRSDLPVEIEETEYDELASKITATCASYGWGILLSYGTGVNADKSNPELEEYMRSNLWNPLRHGFQIVGRKEGSYESIIGTRESTGSRAGDPISGWRTLREGIHPNYAIQNAELKLDRGLKEGGFVHRILQSNLDTFFESHPFDSYFDDGR